MWYFCNLPMPDWVPVKYGKEVARSYWQYLRERELDLSRGVKPSTDEIQPWEEYLYEYLSAELEAAE